MIVKNLHQLSGCIVCVVCGGNDNMVTPLSRASRMASRLLVCEAWPSRRSRCLFSIEEFTDVLKCFSHIRKQSLSIQLESVFLRTNINAGKDCSSRSVRLQGVADSLSPEREHGRQVIPSARVTIETCCR